MHGNSIESEKLIGIMDLNKEDLEGELSWMKDNEFIHRGYRSKLTFWETVIRYQSSC